MSEETGFVPLKRIVVVGLSFIGLILFSQFLGQMTLEHDKERLNREQFEATFHISFDDHRPIFLQMVADDIEDLCGDILIAQLRVDQVRPWPQSSQDDSWAYKMELDAAKEDVGIAKRRFVEAAQLVDDVGYPVLPLFCSNNMPKEE